MPHNYDDPLFRKWLKELQKKQEEEELAGFYSKFEKDNKWHAKEKEEREKERAKDRVFALEASYKRELDNFIQIKKDELKNHFFQRVKIYFEVVYFKKLIRKALTSLDQIRYKSSNQINQFLLEFHHPSLRNLKQPYKEANKETDQAIAQFIEKYALQNIKAKAHQLASEKFWWGFEHHPESFEVTSDTQHRYKWSLLYTYFVGMLLVFLYCKGINFKALFPDYPYIYTIVSGWVLFLGHYFIGNGSDRLFWRPLWITVYFLSGGYLLYHYNDANSADLIAAKLIGLLLPLITMIWFLYASIKSEHEELWDEYNNDFNDNPPF